MNGELVYLCGSSAFYTVAVECNYKGLKHLLTTTDFVRSLKERIESGAHLYIASALLLILKAIIYKKGHVRTYFVVLAPSLENYLSSTWVILRFSRAH